MTHHPLTTSVQAPTLSVNKQPGWPEILVGLGAAALSMVALILVMPFLSTDPDIAGATLAAWSAAVGFVGFGAAFAIRIRSLAAFGVRRTTWRWMLIGLAAGVVAFVLKAAVNAMLAAFAGFDENAQVPFNEAVNGGLLAAMLTFVLISFVVPLGEELLFRGVVMRGLLRYGAVVAVLGSSVIFALFHGINTALPTALVVGIIAAEVTRRSGSIWPAVLIHVVNNLAASLIVLLLGL